MGFKLSKLKNSIKKRLTSCGMTSLSSSISSQELLDTTKRAKYFVKHHEMGVKYLKSKRVDFGSPFAYKQPKSQVLPSGLRVAVCISGYLRTFERTAPSFVKNVLEPLNADLFIYAPNKKGVSWASAKKKHSSIISQEDLDSDSLSLEKIEKHYPANRIKKCVLWDYDQSIFKNDYYDQNPKTIDGRDYRRTLSMFYHIEKCNNLKTEYEKENNFEYDIVIRTRSDLVFFTPFIIENIIRDVNLKNTIYYNAFNFLNESGMRFIDMAASVPFYNEKEITYIPHGERYFNDFTTVGTSKNMNLACNVYSNIEKYSKLQIGINAETLFSYHIINCSLNIDMEDFTTCNLIRESSPKIVNEYTWITNPFKVLNCITNNYIQTFNSLYAD